MPRQWSRIVLQKRIAKEEIQMQISLLLMQQIAQLFLVLLMGYAVVKTGLLKASDSKVLSVVFVYLVMPCVVLNAFQIKDTPEIRTGLLYSCLLYTSIVFVALRVILRVQHCQNTGILPDFSPRDAQQTLNIRADIIHLGGCLLYTSRCV